MTHSAALTVRPAIGFRVVTNQGTKKLPATRNFFTEDIIYIYRQL